MNMTFRQLAIFQAVLARGSFSAAAVELGLSQPAVSMQVKALIREVGVPLLRTEGRRLEPTPAGKTLGAYAERLLRLADESTRAAALAAEERVLLRVAASSTPGAYLLPSLIARYRDEHSGSEVRLQVLNTEEVEDRVGSGEADVGVVGGRLRTLALHAQPWLRDEIVLAVASVHRLARRRRVAARDLAEELLLVREPGSATRATVEAAFVRAGVPLPPRQELGATEAIKGAAAAGLGIAFVSRHAIAHELRGGALKMLRVKDLPLERPLQILVRPGRGELPHVKSFVRFLRSSQR